MPVWKKTLFSSASGDTYWAATLQNTGLSYSDEDQKVAVDSSGNVYFMEPRVSGYGDSTIGQSVTKFDAEGTVQWAKRLRPSNVSSQGSYGFPIQFDSSGNPIVLALQTGGTRVNAYRLNASDGSTSLVKDLGQGEAMAYDDGYGFTGVQSDGTIVYASASPITGGVNVTVLRVNPSTLAVVSVRNVVLPRPFNQPSTMRKVAVGPNDEIVLFGYIKYGDSPNERAYAMVLNTTGSALDWEGLAQYSSSSNRFNGFTGAIDSSGNCYVAGTAYGGFGTAIVKFPDNGGSISWGLNWDEVTSGTPLLYSDVQTDDTNVFLSGYTTNTATSSAVPTLMSIASSNGSENWTRQVVYNSKGGFFRGNTVLAGDAIIASGFIYDGEPKKRIIVKLPKDGSITGTFGQFVIKSTSMTTAGSNPVYYSSSSGVSFNDESYSTSSASMTTNSAITWTIDHEALE